MKWGGCGSQRLRSRTGDGCRSQPGPQETGGVADVSTLHIGVHGGIRQVECLQNSSHAMRKRTLETEPTTPKVEGDSLQFVLGRLGMAERDPIAGNANMEDVKKARSQTLIRELRRDIAMIRMNQTYESSLEEILTDLKGKAIDQDSTDDEGDVCMDMAGKYKSLVKFLRVRTQTQVALQSQLETLQKENVELKEEVEQLRRENAALYRQIPSQNASKTSPKRKKSSHGEMSIDSSDLHDKEASREGS